MTRWLGSWRLIPELGDYGDEAPPREALYQISQEGDLLRFTMTGVDAHGQQFQHGFAAKSDGTPMPSEAPDVDTFSVLVESDTVLSGNAMAGAREVGKAMRRISADGALMTMLQIRDFPDGPQDKTLQVFRRVEE